MLTMRNIVIAVLAAMVSVTALAYAVQKLA